MIPVNSRNFMIIYLSFSENKKNINNLREMIINHEYYDKCKLLSNEV